MEEYCSLRIGYWSCLQWINHSLYLIYPKHSLILLSNYLYIYWSYSFFFGLIYSLIYLIYSFVFFIYSFKDTLSIHLSTLSIHLYTLLIHFPILLNIAFILIIYGFWQFILISLRSNIVPMFYIYPIQYSSYICIILSNSFIVSLVYFI